jgi:hypothetical protein
MISLCMIWLLLRHLIWRRITIAGNGTLYILFSVFDGITYQSLVLIIYIIIGGTSSSLLLLMLIIIIWLWLGRMVTATALVWLMLCVIDSSILPNKTTGKLRYAQMRQLSDSSNLRSFFLCCFIGLSSLSFIGCRPNTKNHFWV